MAVPTDKEEKHSLYTKTTEKVKKNLFWKYIICIQLAKRIVSEILDSLLRTWQNEAESPFILLPDKWNIIKHKIRKPVSFYQIPQDFMSDEIFNRK